MPLPTIRQVRQRFTDLESRVAALEGSKTPQAPPEGRREAVQDTSTTRKAVSDGKPKSK